MQFEMPISLGLIRIQTDWNLKEGKDMKATKVTLFEFRQTGI